jgi:hypothetical protein
MDFLYNNNKKMGEWEWTVLIAVLSKAYWKVVKKYYLLMVLLMKQQRRGVGYVGICIIQGQENWEDKGRC